MNLETGATWASLDELKLAVKNHAIMHSVELEIIKSDKKRYTVRCCIDSCKWRLHASIIKGGPTCAIKSIDGEHTCAGISQLGNKEANTKWLAHQTMERFRDQPDLRPKVLIGDMRREKKVTIKYGVAWKAKEVAHAQIHGDHTEAYKKLEGYCNEILHINPGSVAFVQKTEEGCFLRIFIAYNASLKGFPYCRPVVALDGTHLKGRYLGILLSATAIDGNDCLYPLAFAVVAAENDDNWVWFLQNVRNCLQHTESITFISDRQKGLVEGVEIMFGENTAHAYCMRHLADNFRKAFKSTELVHLLWNAARANNDEEFEEALAKMQATNSEATTWILATADPVHWANAKFVGYRYGHLTSNIAESFNSWLREPRELPILAMLELIRRKLMTWFAERRSQAYSFMTDAMEHTYLALTPQAEQEVKNACEQGRSYRIIMASECEFEVMSSRTRVVDLRQKTCTCKRWQQSGIPCAHAACAILYRKEPVRTYVHFVFFMTSYFETYREVLHPVVVPLALDDTLPPATRRPPGRPRSKRIRTGGELKEVHHCARCKGTGHNTRTCRAAI